MWEQGKSGLALEIFRKLLRSNLNDNIGARNYILAIRMGLKSDFEDKFMMRNSPIPGLDAIKIGKWFDENSAKYPEEFLDYRLFTSRDNPNGRD